LVGRHTSLFEDKCGIEVVGLAAYRDGYQSIHLDSVNMDGDSDSLGLTGAH